MSGDFNNLLVYEEYTKQGSTMIKILPEAYQFFNRPDIKSVFASLTDGQDYNDFLKQLYYSTGCNLDILKITQNLHIPSHIQYTVRKLNGFIEDYVHKRTPFYMYVSFSGHATSCYVVPQTDGNLTIVFCNSGDGIAMHGIITANSGYATILEFNNCTVKQLLDLVLTSYMDAKFFNTDVQNQYRLVFWNQFLLNRKPKRSTGKYLMDYADRSFYYPEQVTGDCTLKSIILPMYYYCLTTKANITLDKFLCFIEICRLNVMATLINSLFDNVDEYTYNVFNIKIKQVKNVLTNFDETTTDPNIKATINSQNDVIKSICEKLKNYYFNSPKYLANNMLSRVDTLTVTPSPSSTPNSDTYKEFTLTENNPYGKLYQYVKVDTRDPNLYIYLCKSLSLLIDFFIEMKSLFKEANGLMPFVCDNVSNKSEMCFAICKALVEKLIPVVEVLFINNTFDLDLIINPEKVEKFSINLPTGNHRINALADIHFIKNSILEIIYGLQYFRNNINSYYIYFLFSIYDVIFTKFIDTSVKDMDLITHGLKPSVDTALKPYATITKTIPVLDKKQQTIMEYTHALLYNSKYSFYESNGYNIFLSTFAKYVNIADDVFAGQNSLTEPISIKTFKDYEINPSKNLIFNPQAKLALAPGILSNRFKSTIDLTTLLILNYKTILNSIYSDMAPITFTKTRDLFHAMYGTQRYILDKRSNTVSFDMRAGDLGSYNSNEIIMRGDFPKTENRFIFYKLISDIDEFIQLFSNGHNIKHTVVTPFIYYSFINSKNDNDKCDVQINLNNQHNSAISIKKFVSNPILKRYIDAIPDDIVEKLRSNAVIYKIHEFVISIYVLYYIYNLKDKLDILWKELEKDNYVNVWLQIIEYRNTLYGLYKRDVATIDSKLVARNADIGSIYNIINILMIDIILIEKNKNTKQFNLYANKSLNEIPLINELIRFIDDKFSDREVMFNFKTRYSPVAEENEDHTVSTFDNGEFYPNHSAIATMYDFSTGILYKRKNDSINVAPSAEYSELCNTIHTLYLFYLHRNSITYGNENYVFNNLSYNDNINEVVSHLKSTQSTSHNNYYAKPDNSFIYAPVYGLKKYNFNNITENDFARLPASIYLPLSNVNPPTITFNEGVTTYTYRCQFNYPSTTYFCGLFKNQFNREMDDSPILTYETSNVKYEFLETNNTLYLRKLVGFNINPTDNYVFYSPFDKNFGKRDILNQFFSRFYNLFYVGYFYNADANHIFIICKDTSMVYEYKDKTIHYNGYAILDINTDQKVLSRWVNYSKNMFIVTKDNSYSIMIINKLKVVSYDKQHYNPGLVYEATDSNMYEKIVNKIKNTFNKSHYFLPIHYSNLFLNTDDFESLIVYILYCFLYNKVDTFQDVLVYYLNLERSNKYVEIKSLLERFFLKDTSFKYNIFGNYIVDTCLNKIAENIYNYRFKLHTIPKMLLAPDLMQNNSLRLSDTSAIAPYTFIKKLTNAVRLLTTLELVMKYIFQTSPLPDASVDYDIVIDHQAMFVIWEIFSIIGKNMGYNFFGDEFPKTVPNLEKYRITLKPYLGFYFINLNINSDYARKETNSQTNISTSKAILRIFSTIEFVDIQNKTVKLHPISFLLCLASTLNRYQNYNIDGKSIDEKVPMPFKLDMPKQDYINFGATVRFDESALLKDDNIGDAIINNYHAYKTTWDLNYSNFVEYLYNQTLIYSTSLEDKNDTVKLLYSLLTKQVKTRGFSTPEADVKQTNIYGYTEFFYCFCYGVFPTKKQIDIVNKITRTLMDKKIKGMDYIYNVEPTRSLAGGFYNLYQRFVGELSQEDVVELEPNTIFNMPMGMGKTSVVTPLVILRLLAYLNMFPTERTDNIYIVLPESLVEQSYLLFAKYIGNYIPVPVYYLYETRNDDSSSTSTNKPQAINTITDTIKQVGIKNSICICSDISLKSAILNSYDEFNRARERHFYLMDEVDTLVDPTKDEVNFTTGTLEHIGDFEVTYDIFKMFVKIIYSTSVEEINNFKTYSYMIPKMLEYFNLWNEFLTNNPGNWVREPQFCLSEPSVKFIIELKELLATMLINLFVAHKRADKGFSRVVITEMIKVISSPELDGGVSIIAEEVITKYKNFLFNCKVFITDLATSVLKLVDRRDYGIISKFSLIVPFSSLETPVSESQFSNPIMVLFLTIIAHNNLSRNLNEDNVHKYFNKLTTQKVINKVQSEILDENDTIIEEIKRLELESSFYTLTSINEIPTTKIKTILSNDVFTHSTIADQCKDNINFYTEIKMATGVDILSSTLIKNRVGYTGTPESIIPWYDPIRRINIEDIADEDKMLINNVFTNELMPSIDQLPYSDSKTFLRELFVKYLLMPDVLFRVLIDVNGTLLGITYLEVAEVILELSSSTDPIVSGKAMEINSLVYWDDKHIVREYLFRDVNKVTILFNNRQQATDIFFFYDQQHITGTDAKINKKARGVCIVNSGCNYRDFVQAAYRLRSLRLSETPYHQTVSVIMPSRTYETAIVKIAEQIKDKQRVLTDQEKLQIWLKSNEEIKKMGDALLMNKHALITTYRYTIWTDDRINTTNPLKQRSLIIPGAFIYPESIQYLVSRDNAYRREINKMIGYVTDYKDKRGISIADFKLRFADIISDDASGESALQKVTVLVREQQMTMEITQTKTMERSLILLKGIYINLVYNNINDFFKADNHKEDKILTDSSKQTDVVIYYSYLSTKIIAPVGFIVKATKDGKLAIYIETYYIIGTLLSIIKSKPDEVARLDYDIFVYNQALNLLHTTKSLTKDNSNINEITALLLSLKNVIYTNYVFNMDEYIILFNCKNKDIIAKNLLVREFSPGSNLAYFVPFLLNPTEDTFKRFITNDNKKPLTLLGTFNKCRKFLSSVGDTCVASFKDIAEQNKLTCFIGESDLIKIIDEEKEQETHQELLFIKQMQDAINTDSLIKTDENYKTAIRYFIKNNLANKDPAKYNKLINAILKHFNIISQEFTIADIDKELLQERLDAVLDPELITRGSIYNEEDCSEYNETFLLKVLDKYNLSNTGVKQDFCRRILMHLAKEKIPYIELPANITQNDLIDKYQELDISRLTPLTDNDLLKIRDISRIDDDTLYHLAYSIVFGSLFKKSDASYSGAYWDKMVGLISKLEFPPGLPWTPQLVKFRCHAYLYGWRGYDKLIVNGEECSEEHFFKDVTARMMVKKTELKQRMNELEKDVIPPMEYPSNIDASKMFIDDQCLYISFLERAKAGEKFTLQKRLKEQLSIEVPFIINLSPNFKEIVMKRGLTTKITDDPENKEIYRKYKFKYLDKLGDDSSRIILLKSFEKNIEKFIKDTYREINLSYVNRLYFDKALINSKDIKNILENKKSLELITISVNKDYVDIAYNNEIKTLTTIPEFLNKLPHFSFISQEHYNKCVELSSNTNMNETLVFSINNSSAIWETCKRIKYFSGLSYSTFNDQYGGTNNVVYGNKLIIDNLIYFFRFINVDYTLHKLDLNIVSKRCLFSDSSNLVRFNDLVYDKEHIILIKHNIVSIRNLLLLDAVLGVPNDKTHIISEDYLAENDINVIIADSVYDDVKHHKLIFRASNSNISSITSSLDVLSEMILLEESSVKQQFNTYFEYNLYLFKAEATSKFKDFFNTVDLPYKIGLGEDRLSFVDISYISGSIKIHKSDNINTIIQHIKDEFKADGKDDAIKSLTNLDGSIAYEISEFEYDKFISIVNKYNTIKVIDSDVPLIFEKYYVKFYGSVDDTEKQTRLVEYISSVTNPPNSINIGKVYSFGRNTYFEIDCNLVAEEVKRFEKFLKDLSYIYDKSLSDSLCESLYLVDSSKIQDENVFENILSSVTVRYPIDDEKLFRYKINDKQIDQLLYKYEGNIDDFLPEKILIELDEFLASFRDLMEEYNKYEDYEPSKNGGSFVKFDSYLEALSGLAGRYEPEFKLDAYNKAILDRVSYLSEYKTYLIENDISALSKEFEENAKAILKVYPEFLLASKINKPFTKEKKTKLTQYMGLMRALIASYRDEYNLKHIIDDVIQKQSDLEI